MLHVVSQVSSGGRLGNRLFEHFEWNHLTIIDDSQFRRPVSALV